MSNFFKHKMRGKSPGEIVGMIIFGIIAVIGLAILFGFIIMWLWNWIMPELFGLTTLTYWQAIGLFILLKILLGGCGGFGGNNSSKNTKCKKEPKGEFSKWKHYDKFWKEEGNKAYEEYIERTTKDNESND
ncbi:hypothetical protein VOI54_10395 [Tamlana sp. 2201CG12-4]|uniref:hypothetical protein n=1 Tax=Tamlana sp. 2201CG12-4 TaxID=3112582 RepID=UPI002DB74027|nr:hypothetical protein [Tamlana sp. 2201CG12-4]MEC3907429.1 hypothetical protein [Tamlana sp. 2201CG12-4]